MANDLAELSSIATALEDLTSRITSIAEATADDPDDDLATELFEVERALRSADRRLSRVVRSLR